MIDPNATLEEVQEIFKNDRFATGNGCRVVEAAPGHAVCELDITPEHMNEKGGVMGGAIFTLADFAIAIASNVGQEPTVSVSFTAEFLNGVRGTRLTATADTEKDGRTLGYYTCLITDDLGTKVARVVGTCMHTRPKV